MWGGGILSLMGGGGAQLLSALRSVRYGSGLSRTANASVGSEDSFCGKFQEILSSGVRRWQLYKPTVL